MREVLAEEDEARARAAERLVSRRRYDVAVREGVCELLRGDKPGRVRDVRHQERALLVRNRAKRAVVPVARVRGRAADE
jgi:hypothetical protein